MRLELVAVCVLAILHIYLSLAEAAIHAIVELDILQLHGMADCMTTLPCLLQLTRRWQKLSSNHLS